MGNRVRFAVSPPILGQLREATGALHEAVERRLDVLRPGLGRRDYVAILAAMFGFYEPAERELRRMVKAWSSTCWIGGRSRCSCRI